MVSEMMRSLRSATVLRRVAVRYFDITADVHLKHRVSMCHALLAERDLLDRVILAASGVIP